MAMGRAYRHIYLSLEGILSIPTFRMPHLPPGCPPPNAENAPIFVDWQGWGKIVKIRVFYRFKPESPLYAAVKAHHGHKYPHAR